MKVLKSMPEEMLMMSSSGIQLGLDWKRKVSNLWMLLLRGGGSIIQLSPSDSRVDEAQVPSPKSSWKKKNWNGG
jgi:hypothetical protein